MVGACLTGVGSNAPPLRLPREYCGTQLGTRWTLPPGARHWVRCLESQPHPGPGLTLWAGNGLLPRNPSSDPITAYRWPPQDGLSAMENVRSLMANLLASV